MLAGWEVSSDSKTQKQLRAITEASVTRATAGGRVLSPQLFVSKWLHYNSREDTEHFYLHQALSGVWTVHGWILAKVGDGTEQISFHFGSYLSLLQFHLPLSLSLCHTVNMCKCLFFVVWQRLLYGLASVRRAQNIQWLTKPNYPRLLPFHRGSESQTVYPRRGVWGLCLG